MVQAVPPRDVRREIDAPLRPFELVRLTSAGGGRAQDPGSALRVWNDGTVTFVSARGRARFRLSTAQRNRISRAIFESTPSRIETLPRSEYRPSAADGIDYTYRWRVLDEPYRFDAFDYRNSGAGLPIVEALRRLSRDPRIAAVN